MKTSNRHHVVRIVALALASLATPLLASAAEPSAQPVGNYTLAKGPMEVTIRREDWKDTDRVRTLPIKINIPKGLTSPAPVIILSHGLGGSREGLTYLGEYWASFGYVTVQLQHPGSDEGVWKGVPLAEIMATMKKAANPQELVARAEDVKFAVDYLTELNKSDADLKGKLDLDHIGMSGHSFGAHTTLAVAGQRFPAAGPRAGKLADPRIKAAIPLSPTAPSNTDLDVAFGSITIPVFHMTGTEDKSPINDVMKPEERQLPYQHSNASDEYLLVVTGADHMTFGGPRAKESKLIRRGGDRSKDPAFQTVIQHASLAFWDRYLRGNTEAATWLDGDGLKKEVAPLGTIEMKKPNRP